MRIQLRLTDNSLSADELDHLTRQFAAFARGEGVEIAATADESSLVPGSGHRGDPITIGLISLELIKSGAIATLFGLLKSYFDRSEELSIEFANTEGTPIKFAMKNLSFDKFKAVFQELQKRNEGFDRSAGRAAEMDSALQKQNSGASRDLAVLVGVGKFDDNSFKPLRFSKNDVDDLDRVLTSPDIAEFKTRKLYDAQSGEILDALENEFRRLQPQNKLIFYYAGHGRRAANGKLYLVAKNTKAEALRRTAISIDEVLEMMQETRSLQRLMILDCCHSGAIGGQFRGQISESLEVLAESRGTVILSASTGIQLAEERESLAANDSGNGIFTRYIVEGLETGSAADNTDHITADGLYRYAYNRVVTTSATQTPMKSIFGGVGEIIIGKSISSGWRAQRNPIREKFRSLHDDGVILGTQLDDVLGVTNKEWVQMDHNERVLAERLLLYWRKEIRLPQVFEKLNPAPPKPPEIPPDGDPLSNKTPSSGVVVIATLFTVIMVIIVVIGIIAGAHG
jgi:uncharacterized caspase-like protein